MKSVKILGETYTIIKKKYDEEESFARSNISGFCDGWTKQIVYCDMDTFKDWENEPDGTKRGYEKQTLRHEIVHAFLNESGLMECSETHDGPWAHHEEMVDWIASQGAKIYKAWEEAECLP